MTRGGLGDNDPLAARPRRVPSVIPPAEPTPSPAAVDDHDGPPARPARRAARSSTKVVPGNKRQVTVYIDADVDNEARNAILALMSNPAGHRNLSGLIETAIAREVQRLQGELHGGKPFPQRQVELQPGRPAGI